MHAIFDRASRCMHSPTLCANVHVLFARHLSTFKVRVSTGHLRGAGTRANVDISLIGKGKCSPAIFLDPLKASVVKYGKNMEKTVRLDATS